MSPARLFQLHARPEALRRLSPAFPPIRSIEQSGGFEKGTTVRIRVGFPVLAVTWLAVLDEVDEGHLFVDVQKSGPFRAWRHEHRFLPAPGGCRMRDRVSWTSRVILTPLDELIVRPLLEQYFKMRHAALEEWVREENDRTIPETSGKEREAS